MVNSLPIQKNKGGHSKKHNMKKLIFLLGLIVISSTFASAQTFTFDVTINYAGTNGPFYVYCQAILYNTNVYPAAPTQATGSPFYSSGSWPYVETGLTWNESIPAPVPPLNPAEYVKLRVWVSENGNPPRVHDSEWFAYSSSGWHVSTTLDYSF